MTICCGCDQLALVGFSGTTGTSRAFPCDTRQPKLSKVRLRTPADPIRRRWWSRASSPVQIGLPFVELHLQVREQSS